ncbi:MAG: GNAT family N-acetyltransferase, partial [Actinomycetales bacterium]
MTDDAPDPELLAQAHALCLEAFGADDFTPDDWQHALGGVHLFVLDDDLLVAHAAVVPRALRSGDRLLDVGYVEAVAVRASHRGRRLGHTVMAAAEQVIIEVHDMGALCSTDAGLPLYLSRGWQPWRGPLDPSGDVLVRSGRL